MFDLAKTIDENVPLIAINENNGKPEKGSLWDYESPIVKILCYIYQQESFVYVELNRASRYKDHTRIPTLGPFARAFSEIVSGA